MLGTVAGWCPSDGTSVIVLPYGAFVGFGVEPIDHRSRTPDVMLLLYVPGAQTDLKCAACSAVVAWAHVMPARLGTVTLGGPSDTTTVTVVPSFADTPALGVCDTMAPAPTLIDFAGGPWARSMWTFASCVRAWATVRLVSVG